MSIFNFFKKKQTKKEEVFEKIKAKLKYRGKLFLPVFLFIFFIFAASVIVYASFGGLQTSNTPNLQKGLIGHWTMDEESYSPDINIAPFTDYSNKNYEEVYNATCWGGDLATIEYFSGGGYNNMPYKKMIKTADGTGGCYLNDNQYFTIEDNKTYIISAYLKASRNESFNGHILNINRPSDNAYRTSGTSNITTQWQKYSWIYESGSGHAGSYHTKHIIYVDNDLPLEVYWSGLEIREIKLKDKTPYANNGSITGTNFTQDRFDNTDQAMSFNGTSDYIKVDGDIAGKNNVTMTGWALINSGGYILNQFENTGNSWAISASTNSIRIFNDTSGVTNLSHFNTSIPVGEWVHFAGGHKDDGWFFYVNGELIGEGLQSGGGPSSVSGDLFFGQRGNDTTFFGGLLDDVRIYDRALSQEEVSLLYNSYRPKAQVSSLNSGLVGHWSLDQDKYNSSNNRVIDNTPYSNHGINYGATFTTNRFDIIGGAMEFDGNNSYIDFSSNINLNSSKRTVSAWVKTTSSATGNSSNTIVARIENFSPHNGFVLNMNRVSSGKI
jgi:hypothetical protein